MNNIITEIKNTLEGTNSRITEAEEQISELEDRMVEIIAEEQNKGKRMKELRIASEHLGQYGTHKHSSYKGPRDMIGNSQSSPRSTESPLQDKPNKSKERHVEIHTN